MKALAIDFGGTHATCGLEAQLGPLAFEAGNDEEALSLVARALTHDPNDLLANEYHAKLQLRNGQLSGASQTLERLVQLDPQSSRFHLLLGRVLARLNYSAEAEREFQLSKDLALKPVLKSDSQERKPDLAGFVALISRGETGLTNFISQRWPAALCVERL